MTAITLVLALLPGFAWLFFYLGEDPHPEPKKLIAYTFVVGMASAFFALALEILLKSFFKNAGVAELSLIPLLIFALIEEAVKFGAAYLAVHKRPEFDEPVDAMIYMVVAALGFATVENIGALTTGSSAETALLSQVFATTSIRFVGATLLHSLASAVVGYYWAVGIRDMQIKRYLARGLLLATVLHTVFNYLIISYGNIAYVAVFLTIIGFFVLNDFEKLKRRLI